MLRKNVKFKWTSEHRSAFLEVKSLLQSPFLLAQKELVISGCVAIWYWTVLAHRMKDGSEKPVTYVSQTLTPDEKEYLQLEKEGVAITFSVKRFNQYL